MIKRLPGAERLRKGLSGRPRLEGPGPGDLRAVVYLPTWARWDSMRQRPQYVVAAFAAAGHDAYFVDPRETAPRSSDGVIIVPSLDHVPRAGVIAYVHFAPVGMMLDRFDDAVLVYDILDDLTIYDPDEIDMPVERRVAHHHPRMMAEATVVCASAPTLVDRHRSDRPDIVLVENGVDVARFSAVRPRPRDVPPPQPGTPLVGYHGAIAPWFDFELMRNVVVELPDHRFIFVGPVDPLVADEANELFALPNVAYVPERPSDDIAAYVQCFDVGIIPFRVNRMTQGVSPLKMYEYMAAGKPVISTPLPTCVSHPLVRTAAEYAPFGKEIRAALAADRVETAEAAQAAAREASWEQRVEVIRTALQDEGRLRVPG
jgi:glycosyltransferase involved in cell wall biosynthesis